MVFTGNPSSTWTAISYGLELLKKGLIWRVGRMDAALEFGATVGFQGHRTSKL
jgi:hypothetical protein